MSPEGSRQVVDPYIKGLLDRNLDLQAEVCVSDMVQEFPSRVRAHEVRSGKIAKNDLGLWRSIRPARLAGAMGGASDVGVAQRPSTTGMRSNR